MTWGPEALVAAIVALAGGIVMGLRVVWQLAELVSEVKGLRVDFARHEASQQALVLRVDAHHDRLSAVEHQNRDHERRIAALEGCGE